MERSGERDDRLVKRARGDQGSRMTALGMAGLQQAAARSMARAAADRLLAAREDGVPCRPVRDLIGSTDMRAAYAVQELLTAARVAAGATVVGRKIGLTSPAVQEQLGVDQPDFGVLFDDMEVDDGVTIAMERLLQPRIEAEIAFVLDDDLVAGDLEVAQVRRAVGYAVAALEIVDSRIADWDISFADTVADNASSGLFLLGSERVPLGQFAPVEAQMSMSLDGRPVSAGSGASCLGDPLIALTWLARTARDLGQPLRAGQVVLSGALGPMVPVPAGSTFTADISGLGRVRAVFGDADPEMS